MKKTFLHLLLLMGCACCFPSCVEDKAEDAAARLTVSKVSVEVIRTGTLSTGSKATLDVLANRGYAITSDADWLLATVLLGIFILEACKTTSDRKSDLQTPDHRYCSGIQTT